MTLRTRLASFVISCAFLLVTKVIDRQCSLEIKFHGRDCSCDNE